MSCSFSFRLSFPPVPMPLFAMTERAANSKQRRRMSCGEGRKHSSRAERDTRIVAFAISTRTQQTLEAGVLATKRQWKAPFFLRRFARLLRSLGSSLGALALSSSQAQYTILGCRKGESQRRRVGREGAQSQQRKLRWEAEEASLKVWKSFYGLTPLGCDWLQKRPFELSMTFLGSVQRVGRWLALHF